MEFISPNRNQLTLNAYSIDDFVDKDDKVRMIVEIVDMLDLSPLYSAYSSQGGMPFDPAIMLVTWFYAYCQNVRSSRKLEESCRYDNRFIFASAGLKPDHSCLARFRARFKEMFAFYLLEIAKIAAEKFDNKRLIAIDGSKFQASGSPRQNRSRDELEEDMLRIREDLGRYLSELDAQDLKEDEREELLAKVEKMQRTNELLEQRVNELEERSKSIKKEHRSRHVINITDPSARVMKNVNRVSSSPAYNGQISVETETGLIVGAEATDAPNDSHQFSVQKFTVEKVYEDVGVKNLKYVADGGYNTLDALEKIEDDKADVVFSAGSGSGVRKKSKSGKYSKFDFDYDEEKDIYTCPCNKTLEYYRSKHFKGRIYRIYKRTGCAGCPAYDKCFRKRNKPGEKVIYRDSKEYLSERMYEKSKTEEGRDRLSTRRITVERVFAQIKQNMGFRRFSFWGLKSVNSEFNLVCIGHNLNVFFSRNLLKRAVCQMGV